MSIQNVPGNEDQYKKFKAYEHAFNEQFNKEYSEIGFKTEVATTNEKDVIVFHNYMPEEQGIVCMFEIQAGLSKMWLEDKGTIYATQEN